MASQSTPALSEHITLPFDLQANPEAFHEENRKLLKNLFPGNSRLWTDGMFLYFVQKEMPPKPWPKSVAGLPPYFALRMEPQYTLRLMGWIVGMGNGSIADDMEGHDMADWEPLFVLIRNHFQEIGVSITEVMYWGDHLAVILKHRLIDRSTLPQKAANIRVAYSHEDQMERPSTSQSRCETDMTLGNQAQLLKTITSAKGCRSGDFVFLDSFDTGFIEGSLKVTSFQRVAADEGSSAQQWVFTIWLYMGQDSADALPPLYGSAIWSVDGDVLGFARYAPKNGPMKDCG